MTSAARPRRDQRPELVQPRGRHDHAARAIDDHAGRAGECRGRREEPVGRRAVAAARDRVDRAVALDRADAGARSAFGDEHATRAVHEQARRILEARRRGVAAVAGRGRHPVPGDRVDHSRRVDAADAVVALVGDEDVSRGGDGDARGLGQARCGGGLVVAVVARPAVAGDRRDRAVGVDAPDAPLAHLGDEDAALRIEGERGRQVEPGVQRRPAVTHSVAGKSGSGDRRDRPARVDAADSVVALIGDEDAARGVDDHASRMVELRVRRRTAVAREAGDAGAGDRRDDAVGRDLADAVAQVGHEHVPGRIDGHAHRLVELRADRRPAVAEIPRDTRAREELQRGRRHRSRRARRAAEGDQRRHHEKQKTGSDEEHTAGHGGTSWRESLADTGRTP